MAENGTTLPTNPSTEEAGFAESKGKGKAAAENAPRTEDAAANEEDDEDEDDDEDDDDEEENAEGGDEEDGMEEINLDNIVDGGRRTRGTVIDFAKAAEENPVDEDEDEDDDDFQPPAEDTEMSG
ncbi:hypothetical protein ED733_005667 [Metarhizium rileyi]|uniref:Histone chaperone domain-containing protein n=1 Tax=Metarhizium rileyi (strain RCEF 4871) TaxID=1649241 RepID=A0A5C6GDM7_METRR|nr:hypothetical protein ED733_005667 [Metarhizium rileyi]